MDIHQLYEVIDLQHIDDFLTNRQEEHLTLDFKTINRTDLSDKDDRRNFAKALSGFANSSGGLIIWGVEARKNPQGIDCAVGKREITNLRLFLAKLNEFTGNFISPIVEGVVHKEIKTESDKGYAVTLVPVSSAGPHMAKAGEDRYYKRSGDGFYRMEHFDLEDMFGRRPHPKLVTRLKKGFPIASDPYPKPKWQIIFDIVNAGRGTAKLIALEFVYTMGMSYGSSNFGWNGAFGVFDPETQEGNFIFQLPSDRVLHPTMKIQFDALYVVSPHFEEGQAIQFPCTLYCDRAAPVHTLITGVLTRK